LRGLDSRNVAVNRLITPSPAITFPMTAIMYVPLLATTRWVVRVFQANFRRPGDASPTNGMRCAAAPTPGAVGAISAAWNARLRGWLIE
jgi:hypothetical protein